MVEFTERERAQIQVTHDTVVQIKTVLLGANGDEGLCGEVKGLCVRMSSQEERHARLAKIVWIIFGVLGGSGALAAGIQHWFA